MERVQGSNFTGKSTSFNRADVIWKKRGFQPLSLGVTELDAGEFLQVIVREPGVIDERLQDERLAARNGGAVATMHRARG